MNRSLWSIGIAFVLAAATAAASGQDEPPVKVTGCLQNYSAKGTVGTTERGYLLTNVTADRGDETMPSPTATAGAAEPPASTDSTQPRTPKSEKSYLLEGPDKDLKDHVGHKVEITGTVQPSDDEAVSPAIPEKAHIQVTAIRKVASNCSQRPK